jgi:hypothetical protein
MSDPVQLKPHGLLRRDPWTGGRWAWVVAIIGVAVALLMHDRSITIAASDNDTSFSRSSPTGFAGQARAR